jgi:hypothetical protein
MILKGREIGELQLICATYRRAFFWTGLLRGWAEIGLAASPHQKTPATVGGRYKSA